MRSLHAMWQVHGVMESSIGPPVSCGSVHKPGFRAGPRPAVDLLDVAAHVWGSNAGCTSTPSPLRAPLAGNPSLTHPQPIGPALLGALALAWRPS